MLVVDTEKSEQWPQRRTSPDGRSLHCCCICGRVESWNDKWTTYCSYKELDDGAPIPKFCSDPCRDRGGTDAGNVTAAMKQKAKDAEMREPRTVYREQTEAEKYAAAAYQQTRLQPPKGEI